MRYDGMLDGLRMPGCFFIKKTHGDARRDSHPTLGACHVHGKIR